MEGDKPMHMLFRVLRNCTQPPDEPRSYLKPTCSSITIVVVTQILLKTSALLRNDCSGIDIETRMLISRRTRMLLAAMPCES